ncbi:MAG: chromate transporter, partial [Clostridia bacterium]|nr:chromate transporter [Clostridia bacterium]
MQKESLGKRLLQLFLTFLKIGAFTFGGGYVMLAIIKDEIC